MSQAKSRLATVGRRAALATGVGLLLGAISPFEVWFAPKADLWPRWQAHDAASTAAIDHSAWERFLQAYVRPGADGVNRIAYDRVSDTDRSALRDYVEGLARTAIAGYTRDQQRAFWINLYNALTVKLILDYRPANSILDIDISPGLFARGPWDKKLLEVGGEAVSLNDIEHRILRPIWRDPRLHYAVNCASIGCPNLQTQAFTAANAEALLEAAAGAYVNHRRGVRIEGGRLIVSKIYAWFVDDFGGSEAAVLRHLRRYAQPPLLDALESLTAIDDYEYDWGLNGASS